MAKPVINYKGYMMEDPSDRTKRICVPQVVDRNQVKTLKEIVASAIDRGLIAGLKTSAAQSIADGIMLQMGETLNSGTGIIFGDYFAVRPYLSGTIKNLLAPLTAENRLRVRFVPGGAYKLDETQFSFHNVTQSEAVPTITGAQAYGAGQPADSWNVDGVTLAGRNLQMDAGDKLEVYNCNGDAPVSVMSYAWEEFQGIGIIDNATSIVVPGSLMTAMEDNLGVKAGFKVVRTIMVDGVETTIESNMQTATKVSA